MLSTSNRCRWIVSHGKTGLCINFKVIITIFDICSSPLCSVRASCSAPADEATDLRDLYMAGWLVWMGRVYCGRVGRSPGLIFYRILSCIGSYSRRTWRGWSTCDPPSATPAPGRLSIDLRPWRPGSILMWSATENCTFSTRLCIILTSRFSITKIYFIKAFKFSFLNYLFWILCIYFLNIF